MYTQLFLFGQECWTDIQDFSMESVTGNVTLAGAPFLPAR
jgi:hypothetical protein